MAARWGTRLAAGYLALVALAGLYLGYRLLFAVENSEFAGLPLLLLALPWSDWLAPAAAANPLAGWMALGAGILLNALAIGLVGRGVGYLVAAARAVGD